MEALAGQRILITRNLEEQAKTAELIEKYGGIPLACPMISIELPADTTPLDEAIHNIPQFEWIFFTSANSVRFFWQRMEELRYRNEHLTGIQKAVIGPKTKKALEEKGLSPDFTAEKATGKDFFYEFHQTHRIEGQKFLLPLSDIAHRTVPDLLKEYGGNVIEVTAYCNKPVKRMPEDIFHLFNQGKIDWVLFTSSSTARNFFDCLKDHPEISQKVRSASIGPSTSATIREYGIEPAAEAKEHTMQGLIDEISKV